MSFKVYGREMFNPNPGGVGKGTGPPEGQSDVRFGCIKSTKKY